MSSRLSPMRKQKVLGMSLGKRELVAMGEVQVVDTQDCDGKVVFRAEVLSEGRDSGGFTGALGPRDAQDEGPPGVPREEREEEAAQRGYSVAHRGSDTTWPTSRLSYSLS